MKVTLKDMVLFGLIAVLFIIVLGMSQSLFISQVWLCEDYNANGQCIDVTVWKPKWTGGEAFFIVCDAECEQLNAAGNCVQRECHIEFSSWRND